MILYHEASPAALSSITTKGLKCTSRGDKGSDQSIIDTDALLDSRRPDELVEAGVSRDNNLYAYVGTDAHIIDIATGDVVAITEYTKARDGHLLRLDVDRDRCFVSDLDAYDRLRRGVKDQMPRRTLEQWADEYWSRVIPMRRYHIGTIRRPEVMITYSLPAECIHSAAA